MPHLVIEQPGVAAIKVDIASAELGFGRAEANSIVLVADEVSRHHARIRLQGDRTVLEDLKSLNGTYVNRQRIVTRVLTNKDEIWFGGKCKAIYHEDPREVRPAPPPPSPEDSALSKDLNQIREEMDRVTNNMTMIGGMGAGKKTVVGEIGKDGGQIEVDQLRRAFRRLDALYKATKLIASEMDLQKRLTDVLNLAMEVTNAGRGFLMLKEDDTDELTVRVASEMGQEMSTASPSMGIARKAAIDGEAVLMEDRGGEFGMRQSIIQKKIESAMCVPLQIEDRIMGSLYVDSSRAGLSFTPEDLELFTAMAGQSAMAIENVRLYEQMLEAEKKRSDLGRFLSPGIVEHIMNDETELELGGQMRTVTTMFADIRGFTTMSEKLTPEGLVVLLNDHFTAMTEIVFQFQGTLDKYSGDEVMALFGAPISVGDDAQRAVRAAVAMQQRNDELNKIRESEGVPTFHMGIGINTGRVLAGYIGSPVRMDFTVMGDGVNVAARFCSLAKPRQIVVGQDTYEAVRDIAQVESMGSHALKGKGEDVPAFEVHRMNQ